MWHFSTYYSRTNIRNCLVWLWREINIYGGWMKDGGVARNTGPTLNNRTASGARLCLLAVVEFNWMQSTGSELFQECVGQCLTFSWPERWLVLSAVQRRWHWRRSQWFSWSDLSVYLDQGWCLAPLRRLLTYWQNTTWILLYNTINSNYVSGIYWFFRQEILFKILTIVKLLHRTCKHKNEHLVLDLSYSIKYSSHCAFKSAHWGVWSFEIGRYL